MIKIIVTVLFLTISATLWAETTTLQNTGDYIVPNQVDELTGQPLQTVPFPKEAVLRYHGLVPGIMTFSRNGNNYIIRTTFNIPFKKTVFTSQGKIEGNKLKPIIFIDTRGGKPYAYANFDYKNNTITYGKVGETHTTEMTDNPLDFYSAVWQLTMNKGQGETELQITTGKNVKIYTIPSQIAEYQQGQGKLRVKRFTLPEDNKSFGLATDFGYIPATITYDDFKFGIYSIELDGVSYWRESIRGTKGANNGQ